MTNIPNYVPLIVGLLALVAWAFQVFGPAKRPATSPMWYVTEARTALRDLATSLTQVTNYTTYDELRATGLRLIKQTYPALPSAALNEILDHFEDILNPKPTNVDADLPT